MSGATSLRADPPRFLDAAVRDLSAARAETTRDRPLLWPRFTNAVASGDDTLRRFLEESGWAADGAFRTLTDPDSADLRQVRLATSLVEPQATAAPEERGTMGA